MVEAWGLPMTHIPPSQKTNPLGLSGTECYWLTKNGTNWLEREEERRDTNRVKWTISLFISCFKESIPESQECKTNISYAGLTPVLEVQRANYNSSHGCLLRWGSETEQADFIQPMLEASLPLLAHVWMNGVQRHMACPLPLIQPDFRLQATTYSTVIVLWCPRKHFCFCF